MSSLLQGLGLVRLDEREKFLKKSVKHLIGENPSNLQLYRLAFLHSSASKESIAKSYKESNERLEFLGDSVLGMITATYLFRKFPFKDEGFLTEIRSRMVSRESLNVLGRKIGLDTIIEHENQSEIIRFVSENFQTHKTKEISVESLRNKFYNSDASSVSVLKDHVIKLFNLLKDLERNS